MAGPCKPGKEKNANGRCVKIKTCEDPNKEKNANGRCVKKCKSFQHRSPKTGVCLPREKSTSIAKSISKNKSAKLPKRFTSAELSYMARELKHVNSPGTRKRHGSVTQKLEKKYQAAELALAKARLKEVAEPGSHKMHLSETQKLEKKFRAAELALAKAKLKHVETAERGSRKDKPKRTKRYKAEHLALAKKSLKHVKRGTRKMHTSKTRGYSQFDKPKKRWIFF
jgi:hypothetical protein